MPAPTHQKLTELLETAGAVVVALDGEHRVTYASPAFDRLLAPGSVGHEFLGFVAESDRDIARRLLSETRAGRPMAPVTLAVSRRDETNGPVHHLDWSAIQGATGDIILHGHDRTAERAALAQADEARERLRSVLEATPDPLAIIDQDGTIQYLNRSDGTHTIDQILGTNVLNWLVPEDRPLMARALERVFAGENPGEVITAAYGAGSQTRWFRSTFGAIKRGGKVVAATCLGADITQRVRADEARAQTERFEAIGRVTSALAHDLNNLLMAMQTAVDVLASELPAQHPDIEVLGEALRQATALAGDLREPFQERTRGEGRVDLTSVVSAMKPLLRRGAGDGVDMNFQLEPVSGMAPLSEGDLSRVLLNLVSNAREALCDRGRIEISMRATFVDDGQLLLPAGPYAVIAVADDGPGIPEEIRSRVFEPLFTTKPTGAGLGLTNCFGIAHACGGSMEISCPRNGGTKVEVWLPLVDPPAFEDTSGAPSMRSQVEHPPSTDTRTILLAEDDDLIRAGLTRYLQQKGFVVLQAVDGRDALEVAERHPGRIDLLITDLVMPRLSGTELIEALARSRPEVPALAITGYAEREVLEHLERLGVPVRNKPLRTETLRGLIESLL